MLNNDQKNNDFVDFIMPSDVLEVVIQWIDTNMAPEDVFHGHKLENWAYDNGFKKFE